MDCFMTILTTPRLRLSPFSLSDWPFFLRLRRDRQVMRFMGEMLDEPALRRIGLPVVDKLHKTLTFHAWYPGCPMEEDAYGIPKPKDTEVIVPTLLFVPCVGYGAGGYRLGYGGGFYDRTLATLQPKPFTVGLGFTQGYLDDFEPEPHDVPLDAILNDNGVVWPV